MDGRAACGQAARTLVARGPLGLCSISNSTLLAADEAVEVERGVEGAAMEEVFLLILGGDEAEAAIGDDAS